MRTDVIGITDAKDGIGCCVLYSQGSMASGWSSGGVARDGLSFASVSVAWSAALRGRKTTQDAICFGMGFKGWSAGEDRRGVVRDQSWKVRVSDFGALNDALERGTLG